MTVEQGENAEALFRSSFGVDGLTGLWETGFVDLVGASYAPAVHQALPAAGVTVGRTSTLSYSSTRPWPLCGSRSTRDDRPARLGVHGPGRIDLQVQLLLHRQMRTRVCRNRWGEQPCP